MSTILNDEDYKLLAAVYALHLLDKQHSKQSVKCFNETTMLDDLVVLEGYYKLALQEFKHKANLSEG